MIEKFRELRQKRLEEEMAASPFSANLETSNADEDNTRHGNVYEILSPQELEDLKWKERMDKVIVPEIPPEYYEEFERLYEDGDEENLWEVKKALLKKSFKVPPKENPVKKLWRTIKNYF